MARSLAQGSLAFPFPLQVAFRMNRHIFSLFAGLTILCLLRVPSCPAAVIPYGDYVGEDVLFIAVTEDTGNEASALFSAPETFDNKLDFDPLSFFASADSNQPADSTDGQLSFTLMSVGAAPIRQVMFTEAGDYTLVGLGNAAASASVAATVSWTVVEVSGAATTPITDSVNMMISPDGGSYSLPTNTGTDFWNGSLIVDLDAFLAANSVTGHATKIEFVIDNLLAAEATGGAAFIAKKDFAVMAIVPEPAAGAVFLLGILGLLIRRSW